MKLALACLFALCVAGCASKAPPAVAPEPTLAEKLLGSEWRLVDLGGIAVVDRLEATLVFPEPGRVAGNASCNRFVGPFEIDGPAVHVGPLATTRRMCKPPAIKQEARYLKALEGAERIVWDGKNLSVYSKGIEKPLRFERGK